MWCALQALNAHCTWMRQRGTSASVPLCLRWLLSEAGVTQSTGWDRLNYLMLYHQHTTPKVNTPVSLYYENVFFSFVHDMLRTRSPPQPSAQLHTITERQGNRFPQSRRLHMHDNFFLLFHNVVSHYSQKANHAFKRHINFLWTHNNLRSLLNIRWNKKSLR